MLYLVQSDLPFGRSASQTPELLAEDTDRHLANQGPARALGMPIYRECTLCYLICFLLRCSLCYTITRYRNSTLSKAYNYTVPYRQASRLLRLYG